MPFASGCFPVNYFSVYLLGKGVDRRRDSQILTIVQSLLLGNASVRVILPFIWQLSLARLQGERVGETQDNCCQVLTLIQRVSPGCNRRLVTRSYQPTDSSPPKPSNGPFACRDYIPPQVIFRQLLSLFILNGLTPSTNSSPRNVLWLCEAFIRELYR